MASKSTSAADQFNDEIDSVSAAFVKMDHLQGRTLLIRVTDKGTRPSTQPGQTGDYTYFVTDTVVLDGDVTDMIPEVPFELEGFQFAGQALEGILNSKLNKVGPNGRPKLLVQVLDRADTGRKGWRFFEADEEQKATAVKWLQANREWNAAPQLDTL